MAEFIVSVQRTTVHTEDVRVEADTAEAAERTALRNLRNTCPDDQWGVLGVCSAGPVQLQVDALLREVMQNMPEYAVNLDCVNWDYDSCVYSFVDLEDHTKHRVDLPLLRAAFVHMAAALGRGQLKGLLLGAAGADIMDPCLWDADCVDALVQYAIFGEVRYG